MAARTSSLIPYALLAALAAAGCGPKRADPDPDKGKDLAAHPEAAAANTREAGDDPADNAHDPAESRDPRRALVMVAEPEALAHVAAAGGDIGTLLAGAAVSDNRALAKNRRYADIAAVLERDIHAIERADDKAGVGIRGNAHRLFDGRWLTSGQARYDLIGVVYRVDRTPLRTDDRCGDIHMIYRLAYTAEVSGESVSSRLPMTMVLFLPGPARVSGSCAEAVAAWRAPAALEGSALGAWLVSDQGPLGRGALASEHVERVRVNMQSARWPSAVRPDLGGHAEYILRSFVPEGAGMKPRRLENTPDVARLRKDARLRARLRDWIAGNLATIDEGTAVMPDEFLAERSDSVTPRGLSRRANRPYRQLFSAADFADLAPGLAGRAYIGSPEALLRRLDDMTCAGCHQSRTIAGFHFLGQDPPDTAPGNAIAYYMSSHLSDELVRRARVLDELAEGREPSFARAFAERGPSDQGGFGARCGLGDPGFAAWTCADGLVCDAYDAPTDDRAVGTCLSAGDMAIGGPCEFDEVKANRDPHRDRTRNKQSRACADGAVCNTNRVGFPGGMCTASCGDLPGDGACGVIALLTPFNNCLARKTPFPRCLAEHVAPAGLRACDSEHPCRDDYICALTPGGEGACIPPYFLFQMRVDGHP